MCVKKNTCAHKKIKIAYNIERVLKIVYFQILNIFKFG